MNRSIAALPLAALALAAGLALATTAAAQDLVITNARIIVGPGRTIEKGSLVVKGGRIASVGAGPAAAPKGAKVINGTGMTLIAGYIDDHRHIVQGRGPEGVARFMKEQAAKQMLDLLESGVTTVQSGGDDNAGVLELKRKVESGEIKGPRIIASGGVPTARLKDEAAVRAAVDKVVKDGADSIAEVHFPDVTWPYNPTEQEKKNLAAGIDEAHKLGVEFQVHATSAEALVESATHLGGVRQVHGQNIDWVSKEQAKAVAATGALVSSSSGFGSPIFDVFNQDNKPTFRDGHPWPEGVLTHRGEGDEAGYMPVNLRTLYDAGVPVTYSTDTTFDAKASLAHELKTLNLTFSVPDLIKIMGPNSARFIDREKDLGTLEPGKLADVLVLGGDPFDGYWYFLNPVVVIKGGVVMVDNRGKPNAGKPIVRGY